MKLTVVLPMTAMNRIGMTVTSCVVNAQGLELQVSMNGGGDRPLVDLHPQVCKQLGEKAFPGDPGADQCPDRLRASEALNPSPHRGAFFMPALHVNDARLMANEVIEGQGRS